MQEYLLKVKDVVKQYDNYTALDRVNISVPKGSIYGLLGPNGAGKTTLMRIINQIIVPDSGSVFFNGLPLKKHHILQIGYLPEERGLYKKMKVGEQALYLAQLKGMTYTEALKRLNFWFKKLEIIQWWDKKVEELSKGMAQKVQFAITVIHDPKLLIFDEPFSGFDPINAAIIREEIIELSKKGTTIIFSTHRMESVEEICNYIALINKSKTILEGPIEEIKKQFSNNSYEVITNNQILKENSHFKILNQEQNISKILLKPGKTQQEALRNLISDTEVISFKKETPSMEEVFIKAVNNG